MQNSHAPVRIRFAPQVFMENGEIKLSQNEALDQSGYSEKKTNKALELQAGQWLDLNTKKSSTPPVKNQKSSKSQKGNQKDMLLSALSKIDAQIDALKEKYILCINSGKNGSEDLIKELSGLQMVERSLLKALLFDTKGSLDISKLPKEAQDLLK